LNRRTREQSKTETREALLQAALGLFIERGIEGPSLDLICQRAGFSRGAFYVHFKDRAELRMAVMERVIAAWTTVIVDTADEAGGDLERTIDRFVETFLSMVGDPGADLFLREGTANIHLMLSAAQRDPAVGERLSTLLEQESDRLAGVVALGQRAGSVRADQPPRALADALITLVLGVLAMSPVRFPRDLLGLRAVVVELLRTRPG
jgi:TetR/AcrR family transcriptional repressor of nem operon